MGLIAKVTRLGLELPEVSNPGGNYLSVNVRGNTAYVAIQFPIFNGAFKFQGILGDELSTAEGYQAMQLCALNVLAQIEAEIGFENIEGLNHLDACYVATDGWDEAPKVVNGASDTFVEVLGEKGKHSRTIFGAQRLPANFCVGLTTNFTLK